MWLINQSRTCVYIASMWRPMQNSENILAAFYAERDFIPNENFMMQ
jgi:hypothetical protein